MRPDADDHGHLVNGRRVEGGAEADGFGELGGARRRLAVIIPHHAVQRLAPPVVGRNAKARNGSRLIDELGGLLRERHLAHQVGRSLLGGQAGVEIRGFGGTLRSSHPRRAASKRRSNYAQSKVLHRTPLSMNDCKISVAAT
jgi:hypothetical protein